VALVTFCAWLGGVAAPRDTSGARSLSSATPYAGPRGDFSLGARGVAGSGQTGCPLVEDQSVAGLAARSWLHAAIEERAHPPRSRQGRRRPWNVSRSGSRDGPARASALGRGIARVRWRMAAWSG
jgi:hypothetical protein